MWASGVALDIVVVASCQNLYLHCHCQQPCAEYESRFELKASNWVNDMQLQRNVAGSVKYFDVGACWRTVVLASSHKSGMLRSPALPCVPGLWLCGSACTMHISSMSQAFG